MAKIKKVNGSFENLELKKFTYWMCYWFDMSYNAILFEEKPIWDDGWTIPSSVGKSEMGIHPEVLQRMGVKPIDWEKGSNYRQGSPGLYSDLFIVELTIPHVDGLPMLPTYKL